MRSLKQSAAGEERDQEMEISFEPGLEEKARAALKAKAEREKQESMSVWDQYLEKRKSKRKQRSMLYYICCWPCSQATCPVVYAHTYAASFRIVTGAEKTLQESGGRLVDDDDVEVVWIISAAVHFGVQEFIQIIYCI